MIVKGTFAFLLVLNRKYVMCGFSN